MAWGLSLRATLIVLCLQSPAPVLKPHRHLAGLLLLCNH